jgi:hypothetical protein
MKKIQLLLLAGIFFANAQAQKLPNVQEVSLQAPANIKIDGKAQEWGDFKAYNKATSIAYTLADDADNLYLAIRSKDVTATAKIMAGGVTFSINTAGKKVADGPALTYPVTNSGYQLGAGGSVHSNFKLMLDSADIAAAIKQLKVLKVLNFTGVQDTVLSIYNEQAIQTTMLYQNGALICEIAIPKKHIGLAGFLKPFAYQVKLNGVPNPQIPGAVPPPPLTLNSSRPATHPLNIQVAISSPTYFWGEYTLSK